jgi:hypothetical protein
MASQYLLHTSREDLQAAKQAAQEERERILNQAIKDGAKVQYMTSRLSSEEFETHILYDYAENCIIDTTIPGDIKKCIRNGWKIISVTFYAGTKQIAGAIFKGKKNNISIRNIKE